MVDLFFIFIIPMALIWGLGSWFDAEEIIGLKVLPMDLKATIIYWTIWTLMLLHIILNRSVVMEISNEYLRFRSRRLLGVSKIVNISDISDTIIQEKADNISETPPDGRDLTSYNLLIYTGTKGRIKIRGLSREDIEIIQKIINTYRLAVTNSNISE